jgi:hypothetical protein
VLWKAKTIQSLFGNIKKEISFFDFDQLRSPFAGALEMLTLRLSLAGQSVTLGSSHSPPEPSWSFGKFRGISPMTGGIRSPPGLVPQKKVANTDS